MESEAKHEDREQEDKRARISTCWFTAQETTAVLVQAVTRSQHSFWVPHKGCQKPKYSVHYLLPPRTLAEICYQDREALGLRGSVSLIQNASIESTGFTCWATTPALLGFVYLYFCFCSVKA